MKNWINWRTLFALFVMLVLSLNAGWQAWAERNPEEVRDWRTALQMRLQEWFPREMALSPDAYGFLHDATERVPHVVLLHGLDEPGGIWDALLPALEDEGIVAWPFRYPNDQAIELSTDFLAEQWQTLPADVRVVLIGHSMGGLVVRDFVTRHLDGAEDDGPAVAGVVLVGTPNHGSEWARLRVWLEVREQFAKLQRGEFSPLAGLREGTGAAQIDLRPESAFLADLNNRPWPVAIPIRIIGGVVTEPTETMRVSLGVLEREFGAEAQQITDGLREWWSSIGEALGDGVVPVDSLSLPDAPAPLLLNASHRGLLVSGPGAETLPPAVEPIVAILHEWGVGQR